MTNALGLQLRIATLGKIRLGQKNPEKGQPEKLSNFRLTSPNEALIEAAAKLYGGTPKPWMNGKLKEFEVIITATQLPFTLPPDFNVSQYREKWGVGICLKRCDGITELKNDVPCNCAGLPEKDQCKLITRFSVFLPELPGLGIWNVESHGYFTATETVGTLRALEATQGQLRQLLQKNVSIQGMLRLQEKVVSGIRDGKPYTNRFCVPVVDFPMSQAEILSIAPEDHGMIIGGHSTKRIAEITKTVGDAVSRSVNSKTGEVTEYVPVEDAPKQIATKQEPKTQAEAAIRLGNPNGSGPITNSSSGQCVHCKAPAGKPHGTLCKLYKQPSSPEKPNSSLLDEKDPFDDLTD